MDELLKAMIENITKEIKARSIEIAEVYLNPNLNQRDQLINLNALVLSGESAREILKEMHDEACDGKHCNHHGAFTVESTGTMQ